MTSNKDIAQARARIRRKILAAFEFHPTILGSRCQATGRRRVASQMRRTGRRQGMPHVKPLTMDEYLDRLVLHWGQSVTEAVTAAGYQPVPDQIAITYERGR